jgi:hypothetical protein
MINPNPEHGQNQGHQEQPHHQGANPDIKVDFEDIKKQLKFPAFTFSGFNFNKEINNIKDILFLNVKRMKEIADEKNNFAFATILLALGSFAYPVGMFLFLPTLIRPSLVSMLISGLLTFILAGFSLLAVGYIARAYFKVKEDLFGIYKIGGYAYILQLIGLFTFVSSGLVGLLSLIAAIWSLVIMYKALNGYYGMNNKDMAITVVIVIVLSLILATVLRVLTGNTWMGYGAWY